MRTWNFAYAYFVLILQVASGTLPDRPQIRQWNGIDNDLIVEALKKYIQEQQPMIQDDVGNFGLNDLSDVYESQLPPPPTEEDKSTDVEEMTVDNGIRSTSRDATPNDSNVLSGSGHLETNEILKTPNALLNKNSVLTSKDNNDHDKAEINKELAPLTTNQNKHLELEKAVEEAINSLPTAEESPLVPLIKMFNERVQKQSEDENSNLDDIERKRFLEKHIILKLANRAQKDKEVKDSKTKNINLHESQIQNHQNENELTQVPNVNEASSETPSCDCEDGCEGETHQDQSESGQASSTQQNPTEIEDGHTDDSRNTKPLAHVIVMLKEPKSDDGTSKEARFSPPREGFVPFRARDDPSLAHIVLGGLSSKYKSKNINPSLSFEENQDGGSRRVTSTHEDKSPIALRITRERIITGMALKGCDDKEESGQEGNRASFSRFTSNENHENPKFSDMKRIQYEQPIPKELILLKHLLDIMKEKAAANALPENQERKIPQFFFSPSSKVPSPPVVKIAIITPRNQLPKPQLPPFYFPDENSGFKIRNIGDSSTFTNFGLDQNDSDSDSELSPPTLILNHIQESSQQPPNDSPQDLPLFIKNILASFGKPAGESNLQPILTQFSQAQKPAEDQNSVFFRALFAPHVL